jgi:hypothetical protein
VKWRRASATAASGVFGRLPALRRSLAGEPDGTRSISRIRTRGPKRSSNNDFIDIEHLQECLHNREQTPRPEVIRPSIGLNNAFLSIDIPAAEHHLRYDYEIAFGGANTDGDNRVARTLGVNLDFDR